MRRYVVKPVIAAVVGFSAAYMFQPALILCILMALVIGFVIGVW